MQLFVSWSRSRSPRPMSRCCVAVRTGTMKRSQMQALKWSPDRRLCLSYRFLLCRDGQLDTLSGRAPNGELPG